MSGCSGARLSKGGSLRNFDQSDSLHAAGRPTPYGPAVIVVIPKLLFRPRSLEHSKLEFFGPSQDDGLVTSPGFINAIGGLSPIAPWGRTSLWSLRQASNFSDASARVRNHWAVNRRLKGTPYRRAIGTSFWCSGWTSRAHRLRGLGRRESVARLEAQPSLGVLPGRVSCGV